MNKIIKKIAVILIIVLLFCFNTMALAEEVIDNKVPRGNVSIGKDIVTLVGNHKATKSRNVVLTIEAYDEESDVNRVAIMDGTTTTINWFDWNDNTSFSQTDNPIIKEKAWTLTEGDGEKEIEIIIEDANGNVSPSKYDEEYTITYNLNGGTGGPENGTKQLGVPYLIPDIIPEKEGFLFIGWGKTKNATTADYDAGNTYRKNESIILYAIWKEDLALYNSNFNAIIKNMLNSSASGWHDIDSTIEAFKYQNEKPSDEILESAINVGEENYFPIYAWKDGNTIKFWSEASRISSNDFSAMFAHFRALKEIDLIEDLGITEIDSTKITRFPYFADGCHSLEKIDLTGLDTSNVTNFYRAFADCYNLSTIVFGDFGTDNATSIESMFYNCRSITSLDLSNFNTTKVENMKYLFSGCTSLTDLNISSFNTSNVKNMEGIFRECSSLTNLDLSHFDTKKATNMSLMFYQCNNLTSLNLSSFDTKQVYDMNSMFKGCSALTIIDISSFETDSLNNSRYMFDNCTSLTKIYARNWTFSSTDDSSGMFEGASQLVGGNGTNYSSSHINGEYAHIDGYNGLPGYFWCHDEYTISFNANAGTDVVTGMPTTKTKTYGINLSIPETPTREGYIFKGWSVSAGATVASYDATHPYNVNARATLYAVWASRERVKILYNANGGSSSYEDYKYKGIDYIIFDTVPTKWDGAQFLGWSLVPGDAASTHIDYVAGDVYTGDTQLNLYAAWELLYVNVTLNANGGNLGSIETPIRTRKGQNTVMPTQVPTRTGYDFLGWAPSSTATVGEFGPGEEAPIGVDTTLYAVWKPTYAKFLKGIEFNDTIKSMLKPGYSANYMSIDDSVSRIEIQSNENFDINDVPQNAKNVSGAGAPIYAWFDSETSTIKLFSEVEDIRLNEDCSNMFYEFRGISYINLGNIDSSEVTNMNGMFKNVGYHNYGSIEIDVTGWDTSNVTNMKELFLYAGAYASSINIIGLSTWNTSNVTDMTKTFSHLGYDRECNWSIGDLSNWNTSKVTSMREMFSYAGMRANSFSVGNLSNWNTSNVTDMHGMFMGTAYDCSEKFELDFSNWNTSKVTDMGDMFSVCPKLKTIYASSLFKVSPGIETSHMFSGCSSIVGGNGTRYSSSNPSDGTYAHIDGGTSNPGYFTQRQ